MQAVCHTDVGYKLIAVKVGLLSHTSRIYIGLLQQKQATLPPQGLSPEELFSHKL